MDKKQLLETVAREVRSNGYSTTAVFVGEHFVQVRDSKSKFAVRIMVEDAEAKSLQLQVVDDVLVEYASASVRNLPMAIVARLALDMVNDLR